MKVAWKNIIIVLHSFHALTLYSVFHSFINLFIYYHFEMTWIEDILISHIKSNSLLEVERMRKIVKYHIYMKHFCYHDFDIDERAEILIFFYEWIYVFFWVFFSSKIFVFYVSMLLRVVVLGAAIVDCRALVLQNI